MLQRSRYFMKSVAPQTTHQAGVISRGIIALFNGCSQRQLHSLVHSLINSKYNVGGSKYYLHKLCICPKRNFNWSVVSREKNSDPKSGKQTGKTQGEDGSVTPASAEGNCLSANDSYNGSKNESIHEAMGKKEKNCNINESNQGLKYDKAAVSRILGEETSSHQTEKKIINEEGTLGKCVNPKYGENMYIGNKPDSVKDLKHDVVTTECSFQEPFTESVNKNVQGCAENKIQNEVLATEKDAYNASGLTSEQNEADKTSNDNKVQKGKSPNILLEKAKNLLRKSKPELGETASTASATITSNMPPPLKKRQSVDLNKCSTERNFITPVRAMTDFLLKPSDLEGLRKTKRRSPYENDPPITVYWRKDVEAKAIDVWGTKENLLKEILKRDIERRRYQQNIFTIKRRLRDYRREQGRETEFSSELNGLKGSSGKVVLTAVFINAANTMCKFGAWWHTGSHSMFAEAIHSLADTVNQLILAYGIHKSVQRANSDHPYGYTNMRYVSSLISGVGIFCVGSGLSFYHGILGLTDPTHVESYYWALVTLAFSFVTEGATLIIAFNSIRQGAKNNQMKLHEYVLRGSDPSVSVILLEDTAAVIGVLLAATTMGLSAIYDSPIPDAIGSLLVCGLLGVVATFIIYTNVAALVGRSIPQERLDKINAELESDVMIRAIHDVKGIDIGNSLVRYKAEMDFDGGELTRSYLDKQDLNQLLEEVRNFKTIDEVESFILKHGENIVDMLGGEIDRIELKLRKKHPEIRHCDLEIL